MRQSQFFVKTTKTAPKDEISKNAILLHRAAFIDKLQAGSYTLLPLGLRVLKKIEGIIRSEMEAIGGQEIIMPALHPKENWEQTGRWDGFDALIKVGLGDERDMCLGPTHEEVVSPLAKRFTSSYRDLPFATYQFQYKFRAEKRAKSGLLRGREFLMKDLYSFHVSQEDLDQYYEQAVSAYDNVYRRVGLGEYTYKTYASGGAFSKYSHEYQTLSEAGEDEIHICDICRIAVNKEIIEDLEGKCPECGAELSRTAKAIEVGNIFKLGTKFSTPFELSYTDNAGVAHPVIMGCYGIGLTRLIGTVAEVLSDDKGLVWPLSIAPFAIHLLSLGQDEEAEKLYRRLLEAGIEVLWDDRDCGAGEKFADSDLIGCPWRVVISSKTMMENGIELKARISNESQIVSADELLSKLTQR